MTSIWSSIVGEYHSRGWVQFWPSQFVGPDAPEAEVLAALRSLVDAGQLQAEVVLFCEDGHRAWVGPATESSKHLNEACSVCELPVEREVAELRFLISSAARSTLDASSAALEKKSPRVH